MAVPCEGGPILLRWHNRGLFAPVVSYRGEVAAFSPGYGSKAVEDQ